MPIAHSPTSLQWLDLTPFSFDFKDGDVLMFKDEGANSVVQILDIQYQCGSGKNRRLRSMVRV